MKLLFLNGVNLNMTGRREKGVYGTETLEDINGQLARFCKDRGAECEFFQTNIEGELCTKIQQSDADGIILNAGAFTHYSYAPRARIASARPPVAGGHLPNAPARDPFRRNSVIPEVCRGTVLGFGKKSYFLAAESFLL